jgi:hypothetical protein
MSGPEPRTDLNGGELDCLAILWEEGKGLKLSQLHRLLVERRHKTGEAPPAFSTVSTWLRSLTHKGLLKEVVVGSDQGDEAQAFARDTRGMIPTSRSPRTGYEAIHEPGVVLQKTFKALADAYPPDKRMQSLVDFARALGLPPKTVKELEKWLQEKISP